MRGSQSPFTNVSVFDRFFAENLSDSYSHPTTGKKLNLNILNRVQEIYLDVMNEELKRTPITFPVTTACFSIDDEKEI
jgi:ribonucleoside-triphosphate reductase